MYIIVSIILALCIINTIFLTPKFYMNIYKGMESTNKDEKIGSTALGCVFSAYSLSFFITYFITVINLVKVDPYFYPSIAVLVLMGFNILRGTIGSKKKKVRETRSVYGVFNIAVSLTYMIYILIVL